jgi:hypothetical protein
MASYAGGSQVKSGYYVQAKSFEFTRVEKDGGALPGAGDVRWVRVPVLAVMAAAPALGGLFVVALPFLGFGVAAYAVAKKLGLGAKEKAEQLAATVSPGWVPGEAHLGGKPAANAGAEPAPADPSVEQLAKEIEEKRKA